MYVSYDIGHCYRQVVRNVPIVVTRPVWRQAESVSTDYMTDPGTETVPGSLQLQCPRGDLNA